MSAETRDVSSIQDEDVLRKMVSIIKNLNFVDSKRSKLILHSSGKRQKISGRRKR